MNIIDSIVKAHYVATESQVEQLAARIALGDISDNTYLRVSLAHMQAVLGRPRRGKQPPQEPVLDAVHKKLYPAFLRGLGPEDMDPKERERRGIKARTNASTVRYFIRGGGDVRGLDLATVTKGSLRKAVAPEVVPAGTRAERAFGKAQAVMERTVTRMAPETARAHIEAAIEALEALIPEAAAVEQGRTTTIVGTTAGRRTPRENVQLHRGA